MISAETLLKVEFYDVDAMQVVWHGNYPRFLECARGTLLDKIGYNYIQMKASGYAWPIVDMSLRYTKPAAYGQNLRIVAGLQEWQNRLKIGYVLYDAKTGDKISKARHVLSIGPVTTAELVKHGLRPTVEPRVHDVEHMMLTLAGKVLWGGQKA